MLRAKNAEKWGGLASIWQPWTVVVPPDDLDGLVDAADVEDIALNDTLAIDQEWLALPQSLAITGTDAGNTLDIDLTIKGFNQFGEPISEVVTVAVTSSPDTFITGAVYAQITEVKCTRMGTTGGSGDTVDIGFEWTAAVWYGSPIRLANTTVGTGGTIKAVYESGADQTSTITASTQYHAFKSSQDVATNSLAVILGEPYGDI